MLRIAKWQPSSCDDACGEPFVVNKRVAAECVESEARVGDTQRVVDAAKHAGFSDEPGARYRACRAGEARATGEHCPPSGSLCRCPDRLRPPSCSSALGLRSAHLLPS